MIIWIECKTLIYNIKDNDDIKSRNLRYVPKQTLIWKIFWYK